MYQSFIGLEIHIQLLTKSKVFCGCQNRFGDEPNTNVCPVCLGYPGVLPALNEEAIKLSYVVANALNCELSKNTVFERKNYFYPDMPKNYQISQFAAPLGTNGYIDVYLNGKKKRVRIHEVHLEEDAGKMIHAGDMSLCDYNRAGTPLLEIVTEPDLETGEEAEALLQDFRRMIRYLGVCDGNMEEGSMRCDANVSINEQGKGLGKKVEIKNLNSSRFVKKALNYEILRQSEMMSEGKIIVQETRLWNENRDQSESMRQKESAHDYRYFPEPDLPPFKPQTDFFEIVNGLMVELPRTRRERLLSDYGLSEQQADYIYDEKSKADFFEKTISLGAEPRLAATWLASDVARILNKIGKDIDSTPLSTGRFASLLKLLQDDVIHGKIAKQTLDVIFDEDKDPELIIKEKGWDQSADSGQIEVHVKEVMDANPQALEQLNTGDMKPIGFLVGQVMKKTGGTANPKKVQEIIRSLI